jgi:receptor expression-enhancing protein 5/6
MLGLTAFLGLQGSQQLYSSLLRPLLLKHQARLDRVVDGTRNEMVSVLWLYLFAKH